MLRCVHCSDLHFFRPILSKELFTSKQLSSVFFHLIARSGRLSDKKMFTVVDLWEAIGVEKVLLTGDCATLSTDKEYERFSHFAHLLEKKGMKLSLVPGNHDAFTPLAMLEKRFHTLAVPAHQKDHPPLLWADRLSSDWSIVGMDCAVPTPVFRAYGKMKHAHLEGLAKFLDTLPKGSNLLIMNHFPLLNRFKDYYSALQGGNLCGELLQKYPHLNLVYLTGHTHQQMIVDGRSKQLPLQINSGSLRFLPSSSWNLIDLFPNTLKVELWQYKPTLQSWAVKQQHTFEMNQ